MTEEEKNNSSTSDKPSGRKRRKEPGTGTYIFLMFYSLFWLAILYLGIRYSILSNIGICFFLILFAYFSLAPVFYFTGKKQLLRIYRKAGRILPIVILIIAAYILFWPDTGNWRPYTYDADLAAIEAERFVPDEQNAAEHYNKLFTKIDQDSDEPDFLECWGSFPLEHPWKDEDFPEIRAWLDNHTDILIELIEICRFDQCRFPVQTKLFEDFSARHDKLQQCAKILILSANRDVDAGSIDLAIQKYLHALKIASHCFQQQTIVDSYIGNCIEGCILTVVSELIVDYNITDENLDVIASSLDTGNNWSKFWPHILDTEKLKIKNHCALLYERNNKGRTRFSRNFYGNMLDYLGEGEKNNNRIKKIFFRFSAVQNALTAPYSPHTTGKIIDDIYKLHYEAANPDFDWSRMDQFEEDILNVNLRRLRGFRLLFPIFVDNIPLNRFHDCYLRHLSTQLRGTYLLTGLRLYKNTYGSWPKSLDNIRGTIPDECFIDPINNDTFVYKLTEHSFELYSKGENGIDEGSKYESQQDKEQGIKVIEHDDIMIWPPKNYSKDVKDTNEE